MPSPLVDLFLNTKTRSYWNERFNSWKKPPSDHEEEKITRTARMVSDCLTASPAFNSVPLNLIPKGSYKNNTNIRLNSDMDIAVVRDAVIWASASQGSQEYPYLDLVRTSEVSYEDGLKSFKKTIYKALQSKFGSLSVDWGDKALHIGANQGTRVDADIVPAITYWHVLPRSLWTTPSKPSYIEGIVIISDEGKVIKNFPEQNYRNGVEKNKRTGGRYKDVVRILKKIKDDLPLSPLGLVYDLPSSYLLECLAYNCPDSDFGHEDLYGDVESVLLSIQLNTFSGGTLTPDLYEINGVKKLFDDSQPWTRDDARTFSIRAQAYIKV